jgi:hypothetical protein
VLVEELNRLLDGEQSAKTRPLPEIYQRTFQRLSLTPSSGVLSEYTKFIFQELELEMREIANSRRRLAEHISRALNKIRKPSTAEEITELLNRDLEPEDRPFRTNEVAEWLRNTEDTALSLYWSRTRPRR